MMKFLKKLFCETVITWKLLLIYSVATGVIVGLLNCVPFLENTSLTAPAVTLEYWFVAAIFIISNCKSAKEAMLKTFLFFLISQPIIYLVEVPFKELGWGLFGYYRYWAIITLLTIPGAGIAYQIKRDNWLSAAILSVATGFLAGTGIGSLQGMVSTFPRGLLTVIFCLFFAVALIPVILTKKKTRGIAYACTVVIAVVFITLLSITASQHYAGIMLDTEHEWTVVESDAETELSGSYLTVSGRKNGTYSVVVQNEAGETIKYEVVFGESTSVRPIE